VVGYTQTDLDNWALSLQRGMVSFGASRKDVLQNAHGYGLFTGGIGVHEAATKLGLTVIPASTGNTNRQIDMLCDLPVTLFAGTPSYLFHIADVCDQKGIDIRRDTKLHMAISGGEPWSESMRKKLYDRTGIKMYNCYGASEFYGPMFLECSEQCGVHVWADLCLMDVLHDDGTPCKDGEKGNIVVTMLQKEGRAPEHLPAHLAEEIIARHLYCPSMLCLLSLQDWLAMDSELRRKNPREERINVPSDPYNRWQWRMHLTIEQLLKAERYNNKVKTMITRSKRIIFL
jgi:acyl-coenzyme A synthetase/AMP-(fatty) acid ligase